MRKRVYDILEGNADGLGAHIRTGIHILIIANVVSLMVESHFMHDPAVLEVFWVFECVSVAIFSLEYLARVWASVEDPRFAQPILGRLKYMFQPLALVDLIAIAPFFLPLMGGLDLRATRAIRLFRLLRVLKLGRYSHSMQLLGRVLYSKRADLASTLFVVAILLIVASSLMYFAEHSAQPERFPHISSAVWWGVNTVTTVGYGDVVPITIVGKIISGVIALLGLGLFALPAGIIAAGYQEELDRRRLHSCPECGCELHYDRGAPPTQGSEAAIA